MSDLNKFDTKRRCPKCGSQMGSRYDEGINLMLRMCSCGYLVREMPLDSNKVSKDKT